MLDHEAKCSICNLQRKEKGKSTTCRATGAAFRSCSSSTHRLCAKVKFLSEEGSWCSQKTRLVTCKQAFLKHFSSSQISGAQ